MRRLSGCHEASRPLLASLAGRLGPSGDGAGRATISPVIGARS